MWPFSRRTSRTLDDDIGDAVRLAAAEWLKFREASVLPENASLRVQVKHFSKVFKPLAIGRFKLLRHASAELLLLIIAEGIAHSGDISRALVALRLGISLPEKPIADPR